MAEKTKRYRFVGGHADTLANGRPVEPGEFVELTDKDVSDPFNQMLIDDERLIAVADIKGEES